MGFELRVLGTRSIHSPDLAKFRHFGKILMVYLVFGKILILLWQKRFTIGQVFIVVNGQTLNTIV